MIRDGQNQMLTSIYDFYRADFLRWGSQRFNTNREDIEDAWQDALIAFYEQVLSGKLCELHCTLRTYLFAIGYKRLLKNHRKMKRLIWRDEIDDAIQKNREIVHFQWDDPLQEEKEQLVAAINDLSAQCQELLLRKYYEEKSIHEIMQELNYNTANTVSASLSRCLKKLKELIVSNEKPRT